ncbi:MAG TPA: phage holin family protein [Anaerolineales bacterium]|nr:phage holin family protein [Anaerolineales bacterium]
MQRFVLRWAINAAALYLAVGTGWIAGIRAENSTWWGILILALIFGAVNVLVRPLLKFITCPLILATLGLFTLAINTALFVLTGWVGEFFNVGFKIDAAWPSWQYVWIAFLGGIVVGIVSALLTMVLRDELRPRRG